MRREESFMYYPIRMPVEHHHHGVNQQHGNQEAPLGTLVPSPQVTLE
ncbi:hypothetical protein ACIQXV_01860 [Neobacillus sp. NPDC097160]